MFFRTIHVIPHGCQEWRYPLFEKKMNNNTKMFLVLVSWSLASDEQEWNFDIGMVNGLNFQSISYATPSIEMDLNPEKYCEWDYSLSTLNIFE